MTSDCSTPRSSAEEFENLKFVDPADFAKLMTEPRRMVRTWSQSPSLLALRDSEDDQVYVVDENEFSEFFDDQARLA